MCASARALVATHATRAVTRSTAAYERSLDVRPGRRGEEKIKRGKKKDRETTTLTTLTKEARKAVCAHDASTRAPRAFVRGVRCSPPFLHFVAFSALLPRSLTGASFEIIRGERARRARVGGRWLLRARYRAGSTPKPTRARAAYIRHARHTPHARTRSRPKRKRHTRERERKRGRGWDRRRGARRAPLVLPLPLALSHFLLSRLRCARVGSRRIEPTACPSPRKNVAYVTVRAPRKGPARSVSRERSCTRSPVASVSDRSSVRPSVRPSVHDVDDDDDERRLRRRRPQSRRDHPLNLSILLSGGKETNQDFPSSGERTGKSPAPNPAVPPLGNVVFGRVRLSRGAASRPSPS